ncbi:MAG: ABC transporter permease [Candidatus Micrarchaeota archaeon]
MFNAVYVLWLRQLKRYFRSRARIVGSLGQPLLFLVALGYGLGPVFQQAGQGNYLEFLIPGIVAMGILFTSVFSGIEIIWDRQFGFLKETLVAPVSRFEIMLGRTLGGATVSVLQGVLILLLSYVVGFSITSLSSLLLALLFMFLISIAFTALGTAIASSMNDFQGFQLIVNFVIMPLFFLSGALFPIDSLPSSLKLVVDLNPLSYGVDGLRGALLGTYHYGLPMDLLALSAFSLALLGLGSYLFSKIQL